MKSLLSLFAFILFSNVSISQLDDPCDLAEIDAINASLSSSFSGTYYTAYFTVDGIQYWVTYNPQTGVVNTNYPGNVTGGGGVEDPFVVILAGNDCGMTQDTLNFNDVISGDDDDDNTGDDDDNTGDDDDNGSDDDQGQDDDNDDDDQNNNDDNDDDQNNDDGDDDDDNDDPPLIGGPFSNGGMPGGGGGDPDLGDDIPVVNTDDDDDNDDPNNDPNDDPQDDPYDPATGGATADSDPCGIPVLNSETAGLENNFNGAFYTVNFDIDGVPYWGNYNLTTGDFDTNYPFYDGYVDNGIIYFVIYLENDCGTWNDTIYMNPDYNYSGGMVAPPSIDEQEISLYPNPATEFIMVAYPMQEDSNPQFFLLDKNGEIELHQSMFARQQEINVLGVEAGIYYYQIVDSGQVVKNGKLIIR